MLAIVLAIGAMVQTIKTYADEAEIIDLDSEETVIHDLLDWKKKDDERKDYIKNFSPLAEIPDEVPLPEGLEKPDDFKKVFTEHSLRYIRGINATEELKKELQKKELWERHGIILKTEPGI